MSSLTIVSCFYDLSKYEPENNRRGLDFYLEKIKDFLRLDYPLILFTESHLVSIFQEIRKEYGLENKTTIISRELSDLYYYKYHHSRILENYSKNPIKHSNPNKDTPNYIIIMLEKVEMIAESIDLNPYKTSHMAWMDAGISHIAKMDHIDETLQSFPQKVQVYMLNHFRDRILPPKIHYTHMTYVIAGGFWMGPNNLLLQHCQHFNDEAENAIINGFCPNDEMILTLTIYNHRNIYSFAFGDYNGIIENFSKQRMNPDRVIHTFKKAIEDNDIKFAIEMSPRIRDIQSLLSPEEVSDFEKLLEHCLEVSKYDN